MAAGFPTKANFATGDVLSATNMNDLAGTVNLINPSAKGDLYAGSAANTYTKLSVGANNTVLTADSTTATGLKWATASGGSQALTKITSATFTGVANTSTTFDGVFSSTYNNYLIVFSNIVGTSSASLYFQWRKAGPTTHTASYYGTRLNNGTATTVSGASQNTIMLLETEVSHFTMNVAIDGTPTQMSYLGSQRLSLNALSGNGTNDTLGANLATGFILSASTGTIGGFAAVYGLAD